MDIPVQGLPHTLQMQVVEATPERVVMTMPVTAQHLQPWGYLHGGASVALAETAATLGAFLNCTPGMVALGQAATCLGYFDCSPVTIVIWRGVSNLALPQSVSGHRRRALSFLFRVLK